MNSKPIRLLRIIARLNVGGPAIHTTLLTQRLRERGYETILVTGKEGPREGNMLWFAEQKGVKPVILEEMGREINWLKDYQAYRKICNLIEEFQPHVVHTHTSKAGALGRLAARKYNVPVVVHTFHGHVLTGEFGPVKSNIFRVVERFLAGFTSRIVAISETGKQELTRLGVAAPDRFAVIPLGIELDQYHDAKSLRGGLRRELGLSEDVFLVGMVARLASIKNHEEYFEAARQIIPSHPDIHFLVVGDGPVRGKVEDHVRQLGIETQVHFLGMRKDIKQIQADLDLTVLTSRNEGLPVAFLESLSSGTPILGSDVGATRELNKPGWPVIVYEPGNVSQFAAGILEVYQRRDEFRQMAQEVQSQVIRRYNISRLVEDLDHLYRDLLREKGLEFSSDPITS